MYHTMQLKMAMAVLLLPGNCKSFRSPNAITAWGHCVDQGGRYLGQDSTGGVNGICYTCHTNGSESQPIIFRNYQNERVTLDGKSNGIILNLGSNCSYTWFWGLEVMSSSTAPREYTNDPGHPNRGNISCTAPSIKFINMILHDGADGIDIWIGSKMQNYMAV